MQVCYIPWAVCIGTIIGWPHYTGGLNVQVCYIPWAVCIGTIIGWPHYTGGLNVQVSYIGVGSLYWNNHRLATLNRWPQCAGLLYCVGSLYWNHQQLATLHRWPLHPGHSSRFDDIVVFQMPKI